MSEQGPSGIDPAARARIATILQRALPLRDDAPLEDETQRLMLHLSIEPLTPPAPVQVPAAQQTRRRLLPRLRRSRSLS